ncbi:MAG TPA: cysteine synthase family protein [Planktothrix sp.]|jgi:cysteine synthase A
MTFTLPLPRENRFIHSIEPTPLVAVQLAESEPSIWCKLEFLNPSGSTKDRIARYMLEKAWRQGRLRPGAMVVEASSGSTSIALALACAQMGLRFTAVLPEGVSSERVWMIRAYGGKIEQVPKSLGILGAIAKAEEIEKSEGAFFTRQFENKDNPEAHRVSTAQEILRQMPGGTVHGVVSGVGTGGTLIGLYQGLNEEGCPAKPFLALPISVGDGMHVECCSFSCRIPGVVDGLSKLYKEADLPGLVELQVQDDLALETTKKLIRKGFPVGPSSGLNFAAAVMAARQLGEGTIVVTVFPDRMERYFSTELFANFVSAAQ